MPHVLCLLTAPLISAVPEDVSVNTWSFETADDTEADYIEVATFLGTFYSSLGSSWYGPTMDLQNLSLKMYNRADIEPRVPVFESTLDLGDANLGNDLMPEECAVCLSFRGVYTSGAPKGRRRGRVFLGPIAGDKMVLSSNRVRLSGAAQADIQEAYQTATTELTTAGTFHEVWSTADGAGHAVVECWVDDAWDTQRRRGPAPTSRLTFPIEA